MQKLLIKESTEAISKSIEKLLQEDWEIHICSNGYEAADMAKYLHPTAAIIDSSHLQNADIDFLKDFSILIGLSTHDIDRVADIVNTVGNPPRLVSRHLHSLGFNLSLDGSRFLIIAIPTYAKDPSMHLHKELYPAIQEVCNATSIACIEHSIRSAINSAWKQRDITKWSQYFPTDSNGDVPRPSNKDFISHLAQKL